MLGLAIDGQEPCSASCSSPRRQAVPRRRGAGRGSLERGRRALRVSDTGRSAALRLVVSRSHRPESIDAIMTRLGRAGDAERLRGLKVGLIAEQQADLYVHGSAARASGTRVRRKRSCAAPGAASAICKARDLDYAAPGLANASGLFACNAAAHAPVLEAVRAIAAAAGFE